MSLIEKDITITHVQPNVDLDSNTFRVVDQELDQLFTSLNSQIAKSVANINGDPKRVFQIADPVGDFDAVTVSFLESQFEGETESGLEDHVEDFTNPHNTTATQLDLGNVLNEPLFPNTVFTAHINSDYTDSVHGFTEVSTFTIGTGDDEISTNEFIDDKNIIPKVTSIQLVEVISDSDHPRGNDGETIVNFISEAGDITRTATIPLELQTPNVTTFNGFVLFPFEGRGYGYIKNDKEEIVDIGSTSEFMRATAISSRNEMFFVYNDDSSDRDATLFKRIPSTDTNVTSTTISLGLGEARDLMTVSNLYAPQELVILYTQFTSTVVGGGSTLNFHAFNRNLSSQWGDIDISDHNSFALSADGIYVIYDNDIELLSYSDGEVQDNWSVSTPTHDQSFVDINNVIWLYNSGTTDYYRIMDINGTPAVNSYTAPAPIKTMFYHGNTVDLVVEDNTFGESLTKILTYDLELNLLNTRKLGFGTSILLPYNTTDYYSIG